MPNGSESWPAAPQPEHAAGVPLIPLDQATDQAEPHRPDGLEAPGAVGRTMFDLPSSQDNSVTVLMPSEAINQLPSQSLVRIHSRDGRRYLGVVVAGPFHEPDGLRADSQLLVTVVTRSSIFVPHYHGRVQVEILGEELEDGSLTPPRLRPLPNSPVYRLEAEEVGVALNVAGDLQLGQLIGQEAVSVRIPSRDKAVLPRHTAILGTTGAGKSTTVARLVQEAQQAGCAVVLLDVEGEYTSLDQPTDHPAMRAALRRRGLAPRGVQNVAIYHLVGRETANPRHPRLRPFSLQFARLSPYTAIEILNLSEPQAERFLTAYDIATALLREQGIFPRPGNAEEERFAQEIDEFERGYPRLKLAQVIDAAAACLAVLEKDADGYQPRDPTFTEAPIRQRLLERATARKPTSAISWRTLLARLYRLQRLGVFDRTEAKALRYGELLQPGQVAIIDLSDAGSPALNNLVIADLLRGLQEAQDKRYQAAVQNAPVGAQLEPPVRTLVVIEEAHEFLSAERIERMPILFQQVARIAKRGRKRWLGLVFVTQLPQHLPRQLFGLVNSYILHKIADPRVVSELEQRIPGIDNALWRRLPGLAPGQAIVAFPHLARPLLVAIDPAPARLRLVE